MNPIVYIVRGEGVRDNSWEVQHSQQPLEYSNPPLERLDSVPTPLGSNLSIRIFEKGTKPVPNFLPSSTASAPATSVVAAQATPVSPVTTPPSRTTQKGPPPVASPAAAPPSTTPTSAQPGNVSRPSVPAKPPTTALRPAPQRSHLQPSLSRRLRNFRNLSVPIIAHPNAMPGAASTASVTMPLAPSQRQGQPSKRSHAPVASGVNARANANPAPNLPTAKPRPLAPRSPTVPPMQPPTMLHASPSRVTQAEPQAALPRPPLTIPELPSLTQAPQQQQNVTSPSAFGRWKTSVQVAPSDQSSPQLPFPTKLKPSSSEKVRAKPWAKLKSKSPVSGSSFEKQRKAMDSIVTKARAHQPKAKKVLPPIAPLTPPVTRPSQAGPVSPRVPSATSAEPIPQQISSPLPKPAAPVKFIQRKLESTGAATQLPHPSQAPAQQRSVIDVRRDVRKEITSSPHVKAPATHPSSVRKETPRQTPISVPSMIGSQINSRKPTERKLLPKGTELLSKSTTLVTGSSEGLGVETSDKHAAAKPGAFEKPQESPSTKNQIQSVEPAANHKPSTSPRSSIDGNEIGTAARPIVTKEDLLMARRKRDATTAGPSKVPREEHPAQNKASSAHFRAEKRQRGSIGVTRPSARKAPVKTGSNDLFSSEIQESMKSVIEQVLWTVRHYKQRYGISLHDEMKSNKKRILKFIQTHLDDAVSAPMVNSAIQGPPAASVSDEAEAERRRQILLKGKDLGERKEDLRKVDFKQVNTHEMFKNWRKHFKHGHSSLRGLATEAEQLRQVVLNSNPKIVYFAVPELLTRLRELGELAFTINELNKKLKVIGKEIAVQDKNDAQLDREFHDAFGVTNCAVHWVSFLSDQVAETRKKLVESREKGEKFARDVYGLVRTDSAAVDEAPPLSGIIKAIRAVKSTLGKLEGEIKLPIDGESLSGMIQDATKTIAVICKEGEKLVGEVTTPNAAVLLANQDRTASSSVAGRSEAIPRRPRHEEKPESNQESRNITRKTQGPGSASFLHSSAGQKPTFEPRGRARTANGSSAASATPKSTNSLNSLPVVPRRQPNAGAPASVPASQAGPSAQRPVTSAGNVPRWLNGDRPNLRSLMESARTVDKVCDDKSRDSAQACTKRKAEDDKNHKPSDSDKNQPSKKRRVQFAPVLVQGEQKTPYSKEALSSLFFDGYDLLGEFSDLQKKAVEERASQLSRGSVIATYGFIRSYIAALKAEKEGHLCHRPVKVRLPYTPTMKREMLRFKDRQGNGLRSAPGP